METPHSVGCIGVLSQPIYCGTHLVSVQHTYINRTRTRLSLCRTFISARPLSGVVVMNIKVEFRFDYLLFQVAGKISRDLHVLSRLVDTKNIFIRSVVLSLPGSQITKPKRSVSMLVPKFKHNSFSMILDEKSPFQPKSMILRYKKPSIFSKMRFFFVMWDKMFFWQRELFQTQDIIYVRHI